MNNNNNTNNVDAQAIREMMEQCDKQQVIEILIATLENEARLRSELDSLTGTIR
jgi:hypothetical protein